MPMMSRMLDIKQFRVDSLQFAVETEKDDCGLNARPQSCLTRVASEGLPHFVPSSYVAVLERLESPLFSYSLEVVMRNALCALRVFSGLP